MLDNVSLAFALKNSKKLGVNKHKQVQFLLFPLYILGMEVAIPRVFKKFVLLSRQIFHFIYILQNAYI